MERVRKYIVFSGRVQGVGFRYRACYIAQALGLTGWVRNTWDDKVEMEVQGTRESIDKMICMLYEQRFIGIDHMDACEVALQQDSGFCIR